MDERAPKGIETAGPVIRKYPALAVFNRSCLQKPRSQTFTPNPAFPHPHVRCNPRLEEYVRAEERAIDRRYERIA